MRFSNEQFLEILTEKIKIYYEDAYDYIKALKVLFSGFCLNREKIQESGVLNFYLNYCLRDTETKKITDIKIKNSFYIARINTLSLIWVEFYEEVEDNSERILSEIKKAMKEKTLDMKYIVIGRLFFLFDAFYQKKREKAVTLLKLLIFLLIENYEKEEIREYMLMNFIQIIDEIDSLPVFAILEKLLKQIEYIQTARFNTFDYDFFLAVSRHPRLTLENAILLLDILSKAYLEDLLYSRAAGIPLIYLIGTYIEKPVIEEYAIKFTELSISMITSTEINNKIKPEKNEKKSSQPASTKNIETSHIEASINTIQRRNLILDFVFRLIKLENEELTNKITTILLENNKKIREITGNNLKGFEVLLNSIGNAEELIKGFEKNVVILYQNNQDLESQNTLYKPPAISGRVAEDIERIKQNRQLALQQKKKTEEILKKKQQKLHENAIKDLENQSNKIGILEGNQKITNDHLLEYFDLNLEGKNEVDYIDKIFKRYYLPISLLFKKYKKIKGFKMETNATETEEKFINENQIFEFLKLEGIIPVLLKREDAY